MSTVTGALHCHVRFVTQSGHWLLEFAVMHNATASMVGYVVCLEGRPVRRRDFITLLGGASTWPLLARAQQRERVRRIGVLLPFVATNPQTQAWLGALLQSLALSGWIIDRNMHVEAHYATGNVVDIRKHAAELVALAPDIIVAHGGAAVSALLQTTRNIPIVFPVASDPVGAGLVDSLARPGGNATGFLILEYDLSGKWLELLKQIAPNVTRAAVIRDTARPSGIGEYGALASAAQSFRTELTPISLQDPSGMERAIGTFAHAPNGGLIVTTSGLALDYCDLIVALAARYKLPAVYYERFFVTAGGLISYGSSFAEGYRRAAAYVDRILKGEKPADLPVQAPTKYELVINLKTAKALGLAIPQSLITAADEVVE
jgi:putative ABC transport system substrate-binding protein